MGNTSTLGLAVAHSAQPSPKNQALVDKALLSKKKLTVGVVDPTTPDSLEGSIISAELGLIEPIFVGTKEKIKKVASDLKKDISKFTIIDASDSAAAAKKAVTLVKEGKINALMKGAVQTSTLMKAVLDKENGIRTKRRMSHCLVMDVPVYPKLMIFSDAGINIAPDLATKKEIIEHAIDCANALGIEIPQIALLAAVETVAEGNQAAIDAAILCKMAERAQLKPCKIDGPISVDLAVSKQAQKEKKFTPVLTELPDVFIGPDLNATNIAIKILDYFASGQSGGIVVGAQVPIMLMRRSSPPIEFVISCALAKVYCEKMGL